MRVSVLGPLRVLDGDREIDPGGPMSRALVARLALAASRPVAVGTLVDDLWGEDVPGDGVGALQSIVSRTRRRLPDGALASTPGGYVLHADVDAEDFRRHVAHGRVTEALRLWRGEPLADLQDAPFAARLAPGLAEMRLAAVEHELAARPPDAAVVAELAELGARYPYRDGLALLHLQALVACGRTSEALAAYEARRERLAADLGADPSPDLQELHIRILRGEVARSARRRPRLPVALTSFVGRDDAVEAVRHALTGHRLVTVLGPGGAGKTRLAVETAHTLSGRFPEAWLVELATVTGEEDVVPAVLSAMGRLEITVRDRAPSPVDVRHRFADAVADADGLVVLDNCEHLVDAVADVAERLLASAPRLRVLATSREALRVIGEYTYALAPLEVPGDAADVEAAARCSAVRLFTERAGAVDHAFALDSSTLPAVREICRRLDGQPLAIELAAARLRTLTVTEVAARLSDRFRLLTGGSRTLPRHRTLRAVVEWSWELLDDRERDLAERVSVFPAGVSAEGAAAVLGPAGLADPADAGELLDSLADKSLLVPVRGQRRFRMLETLREYGGERLAERGIAQEVGEAHLAHMLALAEELGEWIRDERQLRAFQRYDVERGNLTSALRFAVGEVDRPRAARLLGALAPYWAVRNENAEIAAWVRAVLALPGEADPASEIFLQGMGLFDRYVSEHPDGWEEDVEVLLRTWDAHRPRGGMADLVMVVLAHFGLTGDRTLPPPEDPWLRAMCGLVRLSLLENAGQTQGLEELLDETIEGFRACGDSFGLANALGLRGTLYAYDGDFERAATTWQEVTPLLAALDAHQDGAFYRLRDVALRLVVAEEDGLDDLRREFAAELDDAERREAALGVALAHLCLAHVERLAGRPEASLEHLEPLLAQHEALGQYFGPQFMAMTRAARAVVVARCGDEAGALAELARAVGEAVASRDMPVVAYVMGMGAVLAHDAGDDERAARLLAAADVVRGRPDRSFRDARDLVPVLRASLGPRRYEELCAEGAALDRDAAVALLTAASRLDAPSCRPEDSPAASPADGRVRP